MGERVDNSTDRSNLKASCYCYCGCRFFLLKRELKLHFTKFGHSIAIARAKTFRPEQNDKDNKTQHEKQKQNISRSSLIESTRLEASL